MEPCKYAVVADDAPALDLDTANRKNRVYKIACDKKFKQLKGTQSG